MLAPLLYMLALGGIGAAVMFSGYSQVLRSNAEMTSVNAVRQQLNTAAQTLSAASSLDTATNTILQTPAVYAYASVTDTTRLPSGYVAGKGTIALANYGVLDTASGVRQLDPWGKYYMYCRWDNDMDPVTNPAIMLISAGPNGVLETTCDAAAAVGDDRINKLSVAEAVNRANVWQVNASNEVKFGVDANAVKVNQDGTLTAKSLAVGTNTPAADGAITSTGAISAGTTVSASGAISGASVSASGAVSGASVSASGAVSAGTTVTAGTTMTAGTTVTAGTTMTAGTGITITNGNLAVNTTGGGTGNITAAGALTLGTALTVANGGTGGTTQATARTGLGATATGSSLFTAADAAAGRTALGATVTGSSLFTAADAAAGRTALDVPSRTGADASGTWNISISGSAGSVAGTGITGIVPLTSGGTGVNVSSNANLRNQLGIDNASNLLSGTVPTARLGSGTANSTTFLRGDSTWASAGASGANGYVQFASSGAFASDSNFYWDNTTKRLGILTTGPWYSLDVNGSGRFVSGLYTDDWFRVNSTNAGIYWQQWGGGWHMQDSTWIRSYGGKNVYVSAGFDTGGASGIGCGGGLGGGYTFQVCGTERVTGSSLISGGLTVNSTTNINGRLNVVGTNADWGAVVNWGPGTSNGYGILVGSGSGKYSQFQNQEGYYSLLAYSSWGIYSNGNIGGANFYHVSDRRLKDDIKTSPGLELVSKLRGVSFNWKKDGTKSDGVIAQEIEPVMPEAVTTDPKGFKTVNYDVMFAPIIESIKELKVMFDKISDKVAELFTRVDKHDTELKALQDELKKLHGEFTSYKAAHP